MIGDCSGLIVVCGLDAMEDAIDQYGATRLVSLLPPGEQPPTPPAIDPHAHHRVGIDDVEMAFASMVVPHKEHVRAMIEFFEATPRDATIVAHCLAGVSRSTAAGLIATVLDAPGREHEAAMALRAACPYADPNRRIIALADDVLGRAGRLMRAVIAMSEADFNVPLGPVALERL